MAVEINERKFSNIYEYCIFTNRRFNKPNRYLICRRFKKLNWYEKLIFKNEWSYLGLDGKTSDMKPFITDKIELAYEYMDWCIKYDNNEL